MADAAAPHFDEPEPGSADQAGIIARLAALDDRLGGHAAAAATLGAGAADATEPGTAVDTILLLRQVAASGRKQHEEPIVLPQRIGHYEILRAAGRGAFAFVLEARDEVLRRRVALKVARPEAIVSAAFRRRFIREAELAARLIHPHIVAIHEVGEQDGLVFIASEFCAGGDLAAWLERHPGPVPARQAAEMVRSLATAVSHAHSSGIIHRDIKPSNVLLALRAGPAADAGAAESPVGGMTVKLGDFGLGKLFDDHEVEALTQLTGTGSRLGTPAWMAPEQIDRSFGDVGPATDVHALGLLLDRLLTGRCAVQGQTEAEIFRGVLLDEAVAADRVVRGVPRELAAVCLKCLAKRPGDRYASAADLAADLWRFLADVPTVARPLSVAARVRRTVARRPVLSILSLAAVGGMLLAAWAIRERARETERLAASRQEIGRLEAATELRRGFEAWRTGNAKAALDHLRASAAIDEGLADSFAGRWLLARLHGERDTLLAPADPPPARPDLYCFTFSRDGRTLAAGGADGRIFIQSLTAAGRAAGPPLALQAHDEVNDVAFSPDGRRVASAGEDGRLRIWNVADGRLDRDAWQSDGPLFAAAFDRVGKRLVCGGAAQRLCTIPLSESSGPTEPPLEWQPFAEAVAAGMINADAEVEAIAFLDDDVIAAACGNMIGVVALDGGDRPGGGLRMMTGHGGTVGQIAISPDAVRLLSGGTDREPRVWDQATGRLLMVLPRHPGWIQGCDFSPDGRAIATGCRDGVVRIFDAAGGTQERMLTGHIGRTWDVKYGPGGLVASAGADGTLRRWDTATATDAVGMREVRIPGILHSGQSSRAERCALGIIESKAAGRTIILQLEGRTVQIDAATGDFDVIPKASSRVGYAIAADGRRGRFASLPSSGSIELHTLPAAATGGGGDNGGTGSVHRLPGVEKALGKSVAWTPSGMLFAGCNDGRLLAWEGTLDRAIEVDRFDHTIDVVSVAPAGAARLAIATGRLVRVYPLPESTPPAAGTAKTLVTIGPDDGVVVRLAWSPDGRRLAYGTSEGRVATVDAATGQTLLVPPRHARDVAGMTWSADGRTLITADAECVRFTDVATAMMIDEVRPGWTVEDIDSVGAKAGAAGPLVVISGVASPTPAADAPEPRVGIFDLHRSISPRGTQP